MISDYNNIEGVTHNFARRPVVQTVKTFIQTKSKNSSLVTDGIGNDLLKGTAIGIAAFAVGVLGAWAVSCLAAGVIAAGGPLELVSTWLQAVRGM